MTQWPTQAQAATFYNPVTLVPVKCPWPIFIGSKPVAFIQIHTKCAESLTLVLSRVWQDVGQSMDKIKELRYDQYDGSYNYRPMRGGHNLSMHSYGCAIDWDAADNQQHSLKHLFTDTSPLIVRFKEEGWIWGGDWSVGSIDAMHVQAARVR
jgi:hypothetical protein